MVTLIFSLVVTPQYAFADEDPFEFADYYFTPIFNSGYLGVFGGYFGGSGDWSDIPTAMDWSIGNTVPFSVTRTDDIIFSTNIGSWINPTDWAERMRITEEGNVGIGTTNPNAEEAPGGTNVLHLHNEADNSASSIHLTTKLTGSGPDQGTVFELWDDGNMYIWNYGFNDIWFATNNTERMIIANNGNVGIGPESPNFPIHPLHMASGAHVTFGGVWTNASSRDYKENIRNLTIEEAKEALDELRPTKFNYKLDKKDEYLGFIAEDVPELVASKDRKGLSPMDIVAVLTKVVQTQQKKIEELEARLNKMQ
jgi:hypothetical protein